MHRHIGDLLMASAILSACAAGDEPTAVRGLPSDTVYAEVRSVIGELDGAPEYLFGEVASVALGPDSVVYVADGLGSNVRAYGLDGQFLDTIATEGDGPGELRFPNDLSFDPQGRLNVRQRYRLSVFAPRLGGQLRDSVVQTVALARPTLEGARAKSSGALFYSPSYYYFMFVRHRYLYEVVDEDGPTGDTISVPGVPVPEVLGRANYPIEGGGMPVEGVNLAPFEPRPSWDITPDGRVLMTLGADYEVFEIQPGGDTVRVIDVDTAPVSVPREERGDSAEAFLERLDSIPVPLSEMRGMSELARNRQLPSLLPAIARLHVDTTGKIWVQRWPVGGSSLFDVFDQEGTPLYTLRLPSVLLTATPPYLSERLILGVVQDPVTKVERIAVFSVPVQ
jgi:hypothetical protein